MRLRRRVKPLLPARHVARGTAAFAAAFALNLSGAGAQSIDLNNWGKVTSPVYGTSETAAGGIYSAAELFAGPNKFGSYYSGVLPNGRIVKPAGISAQIGMNPLGAVLTPDGKYLITSNDDERDGGIPSLQNPVNIGGYSLSVVDAHTLTVVSQVASGPVFIGLQVTGTGPYTVWASGGPSNSVKLFSITAAGAISAAGSIPIAPILPSNQGFVSNYTPDAALNTKDANGNLPPAPSQINRTAGAQITFPAGSALSPDGKFLYVACNGDNSVAVIDTTAKTVVDHKLVGYFPYGVSVSKDGGKVLVSNWGITEYKFNPAATYDAGTGKLTSLPAYPNNQPDGFYVPVTNTGGSNPKTSSVTILSASGGTLTPLGSVYDGKTLDELLQVGDTHPSATAIVRKGGLEVLYTAKANDDSLSLLLLNNNRKLADYDLSPVHLTASDGHKIVGAYPNALVASADGSRLYVAEAGLNSVAVLDTTNPIKPRLLGRIPTGWYPTGVALSKAGSILYIINAKGIGEDINPLTAGNPTASGQESFSDSNFIFGSVQKVKLADLALDNKKVLGYNYALHTPTDTSVVPVGGEASKKIKHVIFILHENKTFDSMLGNLSDHFGNFASMTFNKANGTVFTDPQNTGVSLNTQLLAKTFAAAVNYYSDSEESDAGHQFSASGTASDYTEKTLLVKGGRGLLVNKNFEPEDYPANGYIFNNAARNGVSFKDYGALIRIQGTDTGTSTPTTVNDPDSGLSGYPQLLPTPLNPAGQPYVVQTDALGKVVSAGDVDTAVHGLGQSYFMAMPILSILGGNNPSGEARLDKNYPGYNFNISDQRRAKEFIADFDRMVAGGTLPQLLYIYEPNDHGGGVQSPNNAAVGSAFLQQVADGDVGLGMVVEHIMKSGIYYSDPNTGGDGTGAAIFMTYDDAQSSEDHIHTHRTPLIVISPYAKPGFVATRHYVTASIVKTEELLLGLPPNNLGDLFATDLRDLFQSTYNGITASSLNFTRDARYVPSPEGKKIWALVKNLDTSAPDHDSLRLGRLARLSGQADRLHSAAVKKNRLQTVAYRKQQAHLYELAEQVVKSPAVRDADD